MLNGPCSAANDEALNEGFGKASSAHSFLDGSTIVWHPPEFNGLTHNVGDGKACAGVTVARLADRAGVEEISARLFDAQRGKRFRSARTNLQHLEIAILI